MNTCSTCLYHAKGECHRYPPTVVAYTETKRTTGDYGHVHHSAEIDTYTRSEFPAVLATEWCGEWKEKLRNVSILKRAEELALKLTEAAKKQP